MSTPLSPLLQLHEAFDASLTHHTYVSRKLNASATKEARLHEIFQIASAHIHTNTHTLCSPHLTRDMAKTIAELRLLEADGERYYARYDKATKSWTRLLLKGLAYYTPSQLKRFLPTCFSNGLAQAELETQRTYFIYQATVKAAIKTCESYQEDIKCHQDLQPALERELIAQSQERVERTKGQRITSISTIVNSIRTLESSEQHPLSIAQSLRLMKLAAEGMQPLLAIDSRYAEEVLRSEGLPEETIDLFTDGRLLKALNQENRVTLSTLLPATWQARLNLLSPQGHIEFAMAQLGGESVKTIKTEQGEQGRLENYRGKIILHAANLTHTPQQMLEILHTSLRMTSSCKPSQIEICLPHIELSPDLFFQILQLRRYTPDLQIKGVQKLDLNAMAAAPTPEGLSYPEGLSPPPRAIDLFPLFFEDLHFPDIGEVIPPEASTLQQWTPTECSCLLTLFPNQALLKAFYQSHPTPQDILLPEALLSHRSIDLRDIASQHISRLLPQFVHADTLILGGNEITDNQIAEWAVLGGRFQELQLRDCTSLTTDVIPVLANLLPHLERLTLPNLSQGTCPLEALPRLHSLSTMQMFYAASQTTQPLVEEYVRQATRRMAPHRALVQEILTSIRALETLSERSFSYAKTLRLLERVNQALKILFTMDNEGTTALLRTYTIHEQTIALFTHPRFTEILQTRDFQQISALLPAEWQTNFAKGCAQNGHLEFIFNRYGTCGRTEEGKRQALANYRGKILLKAPDEAQAVAALRALNDELAKPDFSPSHIEIHLPNGELSPELLSLLLELHRHVPDLQVKGTHSLDWQKITAVSAPIGLFSQEDFPEAPSLATLFLSSLADFDFPDMKTLILPEADILAQWTPIECTRLLAFFPNQTLLKTLYQRHPNPDQILLPPTLLMSQSIDLGDFPQEHILRLLEKFTHANALTLSGDAITDNWIAEQIASGSLNRFRELRLNECRSLTTDVIHTLVQLPSLEALALPNLPKGARSLSELPKFNNPFHIQLFYSSSEVTQSLAPPLYTGPTAWASVFQIPLARKGVEILFTPRMEVLDPETVACWLHRNDYERLSPQSTIQVILADHTLIDDARLLTFMTKFPRASTLSLHGCPHITDAGILALLEQHPHIKSLDLTACPGITDQLLADPAPLRKLTEIRVSNTGVSPEAVTLYQANNLQYEKLILKIDDAQLHSEEALEAILQGQPLNKLAHIDLSGCQKLTNAMLTPLLARLNNPLWQEGSSTEENPQRLNITTLDLTGCSQLNFLAFQPIETLGLLECVILTPRTNSPQEGVNHKVLLHALCNKYRAVSFVSSKNEMPCPLIRMDTPHSHPIHQQIRTTLFTPPTAADEASLPRYFDPYQAECADMTLVFDDLHGHRESVPVHRSIVESQSRRWLRNRRPGGYERGQPPAFENVHCTPEARRVIQQSLYGVPNIEALDWKVAADVAELIGPKIFDFFGTSYSRLLDRIHAQFQPFDTVISDEMLTRAFRLRDDAGIQQYERALIEHLRLLGAYLPPLTLAEFANLARAHKLTELQGVVKVLQDNASEEAVRKMAEEEENALRLGGFGR